MVTNWDVLKSILLYLSNDKSLRFENMEIKQLTFFLKYKNLILLIDNFQNNSYSLNNERRPKIGHECENMKIF